MAAVIFTRSYRIGTIGVRTARSRSAAVARPVFARRSIGTSFFRTSLGGSAAVARPVFAYRLIRAGSRRTSR